MADGQSPKPIRFVDVDEARRFISSRLPVSLVFLGGDLDPSKPRETTEAVAVREIFELPECEPIVAVYYCSLKGVLLHSAAAMTPQTFWFIRPDKTVASFALQDVHDVREGFKVVEVVTRSEMRIRMPLHFAPFLKLSVECFRQISRLV